MKIQINDKDHKYENEGVAIITTNKKEENGLMTFNHRPIWKRILFREPEIIVLRYIKEKSK